MISLTTVILLITLSAAVFVTASNAEKFLHCSSTDGCEPKTNNLPGCDCKESSQLNCSDNKCLSNATYGNKNVTVCWDSASCVEDSPSPVLTTKPTIRHDLDTNYTPIIAAVAAGLGGFVVFVCCMCLIHSWWLKKDKYTDVNSRSIADVEKKRRKEEQSKARRQAEEDKTTEPSKFDMAYRMPPTVNERALTNYDWARTSYLPGMLEPTVQDTNFDGSIPKLICDDDDDDTELGELSLHEQGEENAGYERGQDNPRTVKSRSLASFTDLAMFPKEEDEPQEPDVVEPEIFESMEELPRPYPDDDIVHNSGPSRLSQEY